MGLLSLLLAICIVRYLSAMAQEKAIKSNEPGRIRKLHLKFFLNSHADVYSRKDLSRTQKRLSGTYQEEKFERKIADYTLVEPSKRFVLVNPGSKWENGKYYYQFGHNLPQSTRRKIRLAMSIIQNVSCIKFIKKRSWTGYVLFVGGSIRRCRSLVGHTGATPQRIYVEHDCQLGNIMHEILHSLGFLHEHNRPDRDKYVTVYFKNIIQGKIDNFMKYPDSIGTTLGIPYDYDSIMHYGRYSFSKNKLPTMEPVVEGTRIGQRRRLSRLDILTLNKYYNCY